MTVVSGAGLFVAMLCWRRLRPDWVLALAGVVFGGLWMTQTQGSILHPNLPMALVGLAAVGLYLRSMTGVGGRGSVGLLALFTAAAALLRPTDALAVFGPLLLFAAIVVVQGRSEWRTQLRRVSWPVAAIVAGLVIGLGEWIVEAFLYFGGPVHRLHSQGQAVGGTKFDPISSLRILSGGRVASEAGHPSITGWTDPWLLLWWAALAVIALLGVYVTWRSKGWLLALTPAVCAACEYLLYAFPVRDNNRYLVPAWALLAISAADGLAFLLTRPKSRLRLAAVTTAVAFLAVELVTQHVILTGQLPVSPVPSPVTASAILHQQAGVRTGRCEVTSISGTGFVEVSELVAYDLNCPYEWQVKKPLAPRHPRVIVLVYGDNPTYSYAQNWPTYQLGGGVTAYVQPPRS
jgi:hypothetical protein